ncbi:hypothetical protein [Endozoicomonas sp. ALD040]|uniref:hypothetical protein n=1 Tax=Endozoicomonas sp. ALD040 TaxID=3403079 RepID=UPI003BB1EA87
MEKNNPVCFHELDFVLPVHRFHISFSYTDAQRLSFIREFILRIVNVSPLTPGDLAQFFSLTKRELNEALSDLVTSGDLRYRDDACVELTSQSRSYFSRMEAIPKVEKIDESTGHFNFELSSLNYLGAKKINENWKLALRLNIDNERKAKSEVLARKAFQQHFQNIVDNGDVKGITDNDDNRVSLYNVGDVRKVIEKPLRISHRFSVSPVGDFLERGEIADLKDSSEATSLVTDAIDLLKQPLNALEIFKVINELEDDKSKIYITDDGLDIPRILSDRKHSESQGTPVTPFLGITYTPDNWIQVAEVLDKNSKKPKKASEEPAELIWLAPSNPFWGKSEKVLSCLQYMLDKSKTSGKKAKKLYKPKLYLPLTGENKDWSRRNWGAEFEGLDKNSLFGYTCEFCRGNVEVIVHSDLFAVVSYHLSAPETSPVPIPFGFMTTDKGQIANIRSRVKGFLDDIDSSTGKAHDAGLLRPK